MTSSNASPTLALDFSTINWFAIRAKAAYATPEKIRQQLPNTLAVNTPPNSEVQFFVEHIPEKNAQLVSIRGTANLSNAMQDSEYFQSLNQKLDIYVHRGFDADTQKVYQQLLPLLDKEQKIILTGHSLGAAISTLLMMYLHEDGFELLPSVNFGQPKVTNRRGVKAYEFLPLTRIADKNDPVPELPPVTLLDSIHGRYEHFGQELILLEGIYYSLLNEHQARHESLDSFWKNLGDQTISDHYMENYLVHIQSKLKDAQQIPYSQREKFTQHTASSD